MKKKLILFTAQYPFGSGEEYIDIELPYLAEKFPQIEIFSMWRLPGFQASKIPPNVHVHGPVLPPSPIRCYLRGLCNSAPLQPLICELYQRHSFQLNALRRIISQGLIARLLVSHPAVRKALTDPDAIRYFYWGAWYTSLLSFIPTLTSLVVRFHSGDLYRDVPGNDGFIPYQSKFVSRLTHAVFVSEHAQRYFREYYRDLPIHTQVFPLGVHQAGITKGSQDHILRIVSVSRISPEKQLPLLARALSQLPFPLEWTHIGGGCTQITQELRQIAHSCPSHTRFQFTGYMPNQEVRRYLIGHNFDLFVNVSTYEARPVAISEALSSGIPVLAPAVGGIPEVVDDSCGILLPPPCDKAEIMAALTRFVGLSTSQRSHLRRGALDRWAERCDAKKNFGAFAEFLAEL